MQKGKTFIGVASALVSSILFGFSFLFTKRVTGFVSPVTLLSWRFSLAFVLMSALILARVIQVDFRGKNLLPLVWIAIFQPVFYFVGETFGVQRTTASESGTMVALIPMATLLASAWLLKEAPTRLQITGVGVSVAGILLIVLTKGLGASLNPLGYLMLLLAVVSASLYSVFAQKAVRFSSVEKTYTMMALGALVFTGLAVAEHAQTGTLAEFARLPFTSRDFLFAILYLGVVCSVIAFLLVNTAIATVGTNRTATFAGIATVVSVSAGVVLLGEAYTLYQTIGTLLVIGGVYLANRAEKRNPRVETNRSTGR